MTKQTTPLRQRMIEDMTIRNMAPSTQKIYVAAVANFSIFHGRSPDKLTFEDVCDYRLHLISRGLKPNSINPIMGALRFFYRTTLGLKDVPERIPYARRADPLPAVLARCRSARGENYSLTSAGPLTPRPPHTVAAAARAAARDGGGRNPAPANPGRPPRCLCGWRGCG
jgi:integrase/recombinase XerD